MASPSIFRAYDIRGLYGKDFDAGDARLIAKAFASLIKPGSVVVGHDNRLSSPEIAASLINGLAESGVDVIDIGMATSPMLYFAIIHFGAGGGIEVTGSHLEKQYNGFKLCRKNAQALFDDDIQEIRKLVESKDFPAPPRAGSVTGREIEAVYAREITSIIRLPRKLKVAVDTGNGTAGPLFEKILSSIGADADFIFKEPDGNYPNHEPDPSIEGNMDFLKRKVKEGKYDMGIATDGDADRAFFLDEKGDLVKSDHVIALLAGKALGAGSGKRIFTEVRGSMLIGDCVSSLGGELVMGRIGHSIIKDAMKKDTSIVLAGEASGHIFFRQFHCLDDGIFASCKMMEMLSSAGSSLSDMVNSLPHYFSTPEYRPVVDEEKKFVIVASVKKEFEKMAKDSSSGIERIIGIDGVRVEFKDGWGLVRASNTSPMLSMRFEARTEKRMKDIEKMFMDILGSHIRG